MTLLQPSFRGRLRLFFAVIVVVPMIAVGVVLFSAARRGGQLQARLRAGQAQKVAQNLFHRGSATDATAAARTLQSDVALATAINERATRRRCSGGWTRSPSRSARSGSSSRSTGSGTFEIGLAAARSRSSQAELQDCERAADRADHGLGDDGAGLRGRGRSELLEVGARVDRGDEVLASTSRAAADVPMPDGQGDDVEIAGRDFRTTRFIGRRAGGARRPRCGCSRRCRRTRARDDPRDRADARRSWRWRWCSR